MKLILFLMAVAVLVGCSSSDISLLLHCEGKVSNNSESYESSIKIFPKNYYFIFRRLQGDAYSNVKCIFSSGEISCKGLDSLNDYSLLINRNTGKLAELLIHTHSALNYEAFCRKEMKSPGKQITNQSEKF